MEYIMWVRFYLLCGYGYVSCDDVCCVFFFQAEDGIRDLVRSRGLGDVYKRQGMCSGTMTSRPISSTALTVRSVLLTAFLLAAFVAAATDQDIPATEPVSYTHLTLPTKRIV
eukprot:TRINITY_DN17369_c0_g1_i1.p1 TRINITY_DN17369_c0_g1~~TRINITY_DN17369_c0_g1_i1.p1  ORF type:complete len:112 (-),score=20.17 TRINITY_DN17369_c0_g1_i1:69-404(-)